MKLTKLFKQFISEAKSLNEEDQTFKVSMPDGFDLDWTVEDFETVDGTIAKKFIYDLTITAPDSSVKGTPLKSSFVMAMSDDSSGVFTLGPDVEKYSGIPEEQVKKDIAAGKESENNALIYGLQNLFNGGKDMFFWTNGTRLGGQAKKMGPFTTVMELLSHEVGVHLTRKVLVQMVAEKLGVNVANGDWIKHDYGSGEYMWPAVGDTGDDKNPLVMIDEETFSTTCGALVSMVTDEFFKMASNYMEGLPKLDSQKFGDNN
jgi:hypothetical protein